MDVADRYHDWVLYRADSLSQAEKAKAYEQFAKEFAELPPEREPYRGWAESMAYVCGRLAMWSRGEDPGEWVPQHQRTRH